MGICRPGLAEQVLEKAPRFPGLGRAREPRARSLLRVGREGELRHQEQPARHLAQGEIHAPLAVREDAVGEQPLEETLGFALRVIASDGDEGEQSARDSADHGAVDAHFGTLDTLDETDHRMLAEGGRRGLSSPKKHKPGGAMFHSEFLTTMLTEFTASALLLVAGFYVGRYRERRRLKGKALHEYDFYPYVSTPEHFAEFSLKDFRHGIHHLLSAHDPRAARQLIFIGEQNNVRAQLAPDDLRAYERLFAKCHGESVGDDTREFLQNYCNIARLF